MDSHQATSKWKTAIYSGVLLCLPDRRLVLQKRDSREDVRNPGVVSVFGGRALRHEEPEAAARRELFEELALEVSGDLSFIGFLQKVEVKQFQITDSYFFSLEIGELPSVCHEGSMVVQGIPEALNDPNVGGFTKEMILRFDLLSGGLGSR
jgi:8-oxo-dGTP pyrophosphatase MutT (NUDIX family)